MTGSCLLHNKLHYNGLMTDLGCMFLIKRRLVFPKTTYRFPQNNVSFFLKQRIVFHKTTCRFLQNNVSFSSRCEEERKGKIEL